MLISDYQITLDVHSVLSQVSIPVPQNDTTRRIIVHLSEEGKAFPLPEGSRAVFSATKADGTVLYNDCIIEGGMVIRYDFTAQTTSAVGKMDCQILVYDAEGELLLSPRLTLVIYKRVLPTEMVESSSEYTALDRLTIEANALIDEVTKKLENGEFDGVGIKNIARTSGTGAPGTRDTYTITMTDNTTYTFTVYNGANGIGGDGSGGGSKVYISETNPGVAGCIWFNTSGVVPTDEASVLALTDNTDTDVVAEIDGEDYGVENIKSAGEADGNYNYTLI